MFDEHTVARFRVASITIGTIVVDVYASDCHISGFQRMNDPEGRTQQGDILNQNALALIKADELGTHAILGREGTGGCGASLAVRHGLAILSILEQTCTTSQFLTDNALLPSIFGGTTPRPPGFASASTINGALARQGDVVCLESINAG